MLYQFYFEGLPFLYLQIDMVSISITRHNVLQENIDNLIRTSLQFV